MLKGFSGFGRSSLCLVNPLCKQEWFRFSNSATSAQRGGFIKSRGLVGGLSPACTTPSCLTAQEKHNGTGAECQKHPQPSWTHRPEAAHTELLLATVTMQVDPQLASNVIFHTRVFFVVQPIQCTTHYCVHLQTRTVE